MTCITLLLILIISLYLPPVLPASYHPLPTCMETSCNEHHQCTSCIFNSTSDPTVRALPLSARCPQGFLPNIPSNRTEDANNCHETGCDNGSCGADEIETETKMCTGNPFSGCPLVVCKKKTCCSIIDTVTCCQPVDCHIEYSSCQVPHQSSNSSSLSSITQVTIAHNSSSVFPYYLTSHLGAESSCSSSRVFGLCECSDGLLVPGCDASQSSSWTSLEPDLVGESPTLPSNLSLTCSKATSQSLPPPSPSPSPSPSEKDGSNQPSNTRIILIAISSTFLGLIALGLSIWLGCLSFLRQRLRSLTFAASYEPVNSSSTDRESRGISMQNVNKVESSSRGFLDSLRESLGYSDAKDMEASSYLLPHTTAGRQAADGHGLPRPAVPDDEDVFTLEDLEDTLRPSHASFEMQEISKQEEDLEKQPLRTNLH
jgi:hypothetical protein